MTDSKSEAPDRTRAVDDHAQTRAARFSTLVAGATFADRYAIVERLGSGGSGEVFHARDAVADVAVALKVLYPGPSESTRGLERMRRELRILRDLDHPGIVRVHDVGAFDGLLYVVMERLEGRSLRERLADGPPPTIAETTRILDGLLTAIEAAHARGVVHRDVKPANVFLARTAEGGDRVVLLDFGLARAEGDPRLTATGAMLGTPAYMSPEQALGGEPGPASDLYGAGLVLWELLHGAPPFEADSAVSIMKAHATAPLPRPRDAARPAPAWADRMTRWLLEKRQERRPASASVALAWLRRRRTPLRRRIAGRFRPRRPALVAVAAIVGATVAFWPARVHLVGSDLVARSAIGVPVRTIPGPYGWNAVAVTDAWPPVREVVASIRPGSTLDAPARTAFPSLAARVDVLTGAVTPLRMDRWSDSTRIDDKSFPRFDPLWTISRIFRTPFRNGSDARLFAYVAAHHHHYPSAVLFGDKNGPLSGMLLHPGRVATGIEDTTPGGEPRMVFTGINNELGTRHVVFSLPASRLSAIIGTPPFDFGVDVDRRPGFYVFLSVYARDGYLDVRREGDALVVVGPGAAGVRLDPADGMPLDDAFRDGVAPNEWREAQHRLLDLLENAARRAGGDDPGGGAAMLEEFANTTTASRAQRGVALGQAARLRMLEGQPGLAARDAVRAATLEPEVPGHLRSLLLARAFEGRTAETIDAILAGDASPARSPELGRDAVLAHVAETDLEAADRTYRAFFPRKGGGNGFYRLLIPGVLGLEHGDDDAVRELLAVDRYLADGTIAFLRALAWRATEDPATARRWIEAARRSRGSGHRMPLDLLDAWIGVRHGEPVPEIATLDRDLAEQRLEARRSMTDLWGLRWAERLHAELTDGASDSARARQPLEDGRPIR